MRNYQEYITEELKNTIDYSNYIGDQIDSNIAYTEYLSGVFDNKYYKRKSRISKIKRIFE